MRILYLTTRLPYAPNRGDRIRSYYILREMSRFAEVSVFSLIHDAEEQQHAGRVPFARRVVTAQPPRVANLSRSIARLHTPVPLTHLLLRSRATAALLRSVVEEAPPDLVVAHCSGVANLALAPPLSGRRLVVDMVDVDSAKWARMAREHRGVKRWIYEREARTLRKFEAHITRHASMTLVVNERERETMLDIAPDAGVAVVPNGIDVESFRPPAAAEESSTVVFCGVMNYQPNARGVQWFVREVWPLIRRRRPDARFAIVGSHPTRTIQALSSAEHGVEVTGAVPRVQPYLWKAAVAVAPIFVAQGVQNKVLEALAAGLPVVATKAVTDGLQAATRAGCTVADAPQAFADAVLALLAAKPGARRERAAAARVEELGWSTSLKQLETLLVDRHALTASAS
jgi:sugar transferase (PEP-CTERM/EpsH1 system associated)